MITARSHGGVVVLAHTPPPVHGQSRMVEYRSQALKRDPELPLFHVNCRYSPSIQSMGRVQIHKFPLALLYAMQALWIRLRRGAKCLYFVPAPGKRAAFLRDCVVLGIIRPFFPKIIFHWHASDLADWLRFHASPVERWIGHRLLARADVAIVLQPARVPDAEWFNPRAVRVVPNGIPDPCPDFPSLVATRLRRRRREPLRLLFLSTASRQKGIFDALAVWEKLHLSGDSRVWNLTVAGEFPSPTEEAEFRSEAARTLDKIRKCHARGFDIGIDILGPVQSDRKRDAFLGADVFLFPSRYQESFGVVLVEAAHFGLPCVTWQPLVGPDGLSPRFHRKVPFGDIDALVCGVGNAPLDRAEEIRADALEKFGLSVHIERMRQIFLEFQN